MEMNAIDYINRGFEFILPVLQHFICTEFQKKDTANWWQKYVLPELVNHGNLPPTGSFDDLKKSLDIHASLKLIQKNHFVFKPPVLSYSQLPLVENLMGWRNFVLAHRTDSNVSYTDARDALGAQIKFIKPIDRNTAFKIQDLRKEVFKRINPPKVPPNVNKKYYIISIKNENTGHLALPQIKSMIESGKVTEGYYICQEGLDTNNPENWKKIETIPELKGVFDKIEKKHFPANGVKRPNQGAGKKKEADADQKNTEKENARRKYQAEELYRMGSESYGKKKYDEAIDAYNEVIKLDPNNALAYCFRGLSYVVKLGRPVKGIPFDKKFNSTLKEITLAEFKKQALKDFKKALDLELDPRKQVMIKTAISELENMS
ncbi:hypothetical protein FACS189479_02980 [Spirochaetia bacterium]|nr:hypothetical protein FACS189479_02980 [Spirochaetia bacterium]